MAFETDAWKHAGESPHPQSRASPGQAALNDPALALINPGYKQVDARKAVKRPLEEGTAVDRSGLVRGAMRLLSQACGFKRRLRP